MSKARLAIVEDEAIVAMDIEHRLKTLGYNVVGTANSGEDALNLVDAQRPDLILMDIMLGGTLDGIEAATVIKDRFKIPVVYLTAYADETTINRAKITSPFGYLTKPFEDRELAITLEMALYKNNLDRRMAEKDHWLATTLNSIGEAVVATDSLGRVAFLNPTAMNALGVTMASAMGRKLAEVFQLQGNGNEATDITTKLAQRAESLGQSMTFNGVYSLACEGQVPMPVNLTVSPITGPEGFSGHVLVFRDISEQLAAKQELERTVRRLESTLEETVNALAMTSEKRDPYTAGHQERVSQLACAMAIQMGLPADEIEGIRVAAMLHDLGKIQIPAEILSKPTRLTDLEMGIMKTHAEAGFDILKNIPFPWPVAIMVRQHHERMNGRGYPDGLDSKDILLSSAILSVADVVEAMSSHRPYRAAVGLTEALEEISRNRGEMYHPDAVDVCLNLFNEQGYTFS